MARKSIETTENPNVIIQNMDGDLTIKGWDKPELLTKCSSDEQLTLEQQDDTITISSHTDCVIYLPHGSSISIQTLNGDGHFKSLEGSLEIQTANGNLVLRDVGNTTIDTASGELSAKRVRGSLDIKLVNANVVAKEIGGDFSAGSIAGQLYANKITGDVKAISGGNITVDIAPVSWHTYHVQAGGRLRCRIPPDTNATFKITSGGTPIRVNLPDRKERINENEHELVIGDGEAQVALLAGGSVSLVSHASDWDVARDLEIDIGIGAELGNLATEITEEVTSQLETHLGIMETQLDSQLKHLSKTVETVGLPEDKMKHVQLKIDKAHERAAQRAEEAAKRAQKRLEIKLAAAQRKAERKARAAAARQERKDRKKSGTWVNFETATRSAPRPGAPVSDEERMMILQMLQDQKISVDEAEKLLAALEGRGG